MELSGQDAASWYGLLKSLLVDIRGVAFKNRLEKLARYKVLYESVRASHTEYAKMFSDLLSDLLSTSTPRDLERARKKFLSARSVDAGERYVTKHDADAYIELTDDLAEKRFLLSVVIYYCYDIDTHSYGETVDHLDMMIWSAQDSGGDKAWNSASTAFWLAAQYETDKDKLSDLTKTVMNSVSARFAMVERTFSELDGNWRRSKALSPSIFTENPDNFPAFRQTKSLPRKPGDEK